MPASQKGNLLISEITGGKNMEHLPDLLMLYQQLFPQYVRYLPIMELRARHDPEADPKVIDHQWIGYIDDQPATITVFKYLAQANFGLGLDIGILPQFRSRIIAGYDQPLSEVLTQLVILQIIKDANSKGKDLPIGLVVEVEHKKLVERYQTYGYTVLPVEYHEPSFVHGYEYLLNTDNPPELTFHRMYLGIFKIQDDLNLGHPPTLKAIINGIYNDHYHLPADHWATQNAISSIQLLENR